MKTKRIISMILMLTMIVSMFTFIGTTTSAAGSTIYVSPNGNDSGNGTEASPYKTITKARDAARSLPKPVTVILKEGTYNLTSSVQFGSSDSNVSYVGEAGKGVAIYGSTKVDPSKITQANDAVKNRVLDSTAKSKLMVMDLSSYFPNGIPRPYSAGATAQMNQFEIAFYCGDTALKRSRWPNPGTYAKTSGKPTVSGNNHTYTGDTSIKTRMAKWASTVASSTNLYVLGFWGYEYNCESCRVTAINAGAGQFTAMGAINTGDWNTGASSGARRVYFYNLPEEIDQPGESYIDYVAKKVYFYPTSDFDKNQVYFSNITDPLLSFKDCTNVTLKNLNIGYCRRNAIDIRGSSTDSTATEDGNSRVFNIENCTIAHTSWTAITYYGIGLNVKNCKIYDTGCGGISVVGGVRKSLTSGNSSIVNTSIANFNRLERTYNAAIGAGSVGMKINKCTISGGIHEGIAISTNDVEISNCKFSNLVTETSDMGAIYYGRDPSILGIKIHNNFFQNIGNSYGATGQQSIYMDDGSMGADIYSNIFVDAGGKAGAEPAAVKSHSAQFASVHDNIFVDTDTANYYAFDDASYGANGSGVQTEWAKMVAGLSGQLTSQWPLARKKITDVDATSATWRNHYNGTMWAPFFTYAASYSASNVPNKSNTIKNNVLINMKGDAMSIWKNPNYTTSNNVTTLTNSIFVGGGNYSLAGNALSTIKAKIGTFSDPGYANMGAVGEGAVPMPGGVTPTPSCTHSMQYVAAKAATCQATGNIAYYKCTKCGNYYQDQAGTLQLAESSVTTAKTDHSYSKTYSYDETGHWRECTVCHTKGTVSDHIVSGGKCVLCDYIPVPVHTHSMQFVAAKAANCQQTGNSAYYFCSLCSGYFTDVNGKNATTLAAVTLAKTDHSYSKTYSYDSNGHWFECTVCHAKGTVNAHVISGGKCVLCDYTPVPVCKHSMQYVAAKAATCKEAGNTAYYRCTVCNKYYTDENGNNEISLQQTVIAKLTTHSFGTTYFYDASGHWLTCTVCGAKGTVNAHIGDKCALCGYGKAVPGEVRGDADGDGSVKPVDVIYAINCKLFPNNFVKHQNMDYNGDGMFDNADIIALVSFILFPSIYTII